MDFKKREHLLVLVAVLCLGAWTSDRLVITPLVKVWKNRSARIAELEKSLTRGRALVTREKDIQEQWQEMKRRSLPLDVAVAENEVLQSMSRWSRDSRLGVTSLKPRWTPDEEEHRKLECRAATQGNLGAVARFLYELERDPLALRIETLEIGARDDTGRDLTLDVEFTGLLLTDKKL